MLANLLILTLLPILIGCLTFFVRSLSFRKNCAMNVFFIGLVASIYSFISKPFELSIYLMEGYSLHMGYHVIGAFIMIFLSLFGLLVAMYAGGYGKDRKEFYSFLLILLGFANLTVMAADLLLFAFAWGSMLVLLYVILLVGSEPSARKAVSVVGAADFMLILGIALYVFLSPIGTLIPAGGEGLSMQSPMSFVAFLLLFAGAIGKAGAWPFHSWIPDASVTASMPVMAILPASLDKLLGIYLLARVCTDLFDFQQSAAAMGIVLIVGGFTVLFAVLMALKQKDARKLLSFHAVSQVGYMVIGFGTGVPVGFAAGLFHMINHAIYKTGLFFSAGAAGKEKGTFDIASMGGLARYMPVTFICALVFSLSISGVPPLNGFYSKWMVYQGAVAGLSDAAGVTMTAIFAAVLIAAMFGSALTLASFIKFMHSVFLGQEHAPDAARPREVPGSMRCPMVILALLCLVLGVFPRLFLDYAIVPWDARGAEMAGQWQALPAFLLLLMGFLVGVAIVFARLARTRIRTSDAYFGGLPRDGEINYPATEFYKTIQEISPIAGFYRVMAWKVMDFYCSLAAVFKVAALLFYYLADRVINLLTMAVGMIVLGLSKVFRTAHTGNLDFYILWCLLAMAVLFFVIAG